MLLLCSESEKKSFSYFFKKMLLVVKKFVFLAFVNNLFFCPKMLLKDQTFVSTLHLSSRMKHLKTVSF